MSYLLGIQTATPPHRYSQETLAKYYADTAPSDSSLQRKIRIVSQKSGIKMRHSVIPDFGHPAEEHPFYPATGSLSPMPSLSDRMAIFQPEARALSLQVVRQFAQWDEVKPKVTHLVTVTCTGLFAPGLDIELIEGLELSPKISRISINFMGCNAAVLALKQAHYICQSEANALVLIVCTELCTLHFQRDYSDDYLISNLLFADGAAAALVGTNPTQLDGSAAIELDSFQSVVISEGRKDMAWRLSERGFLMNLSSYVSPLLNTYLPRLMAEFRLDLEKIQHLALHPGGKRILDDFCQTLNLAKSQLQASYEVLRDYGNMSSATLLFVLQRLQDQKEFQPGDVTFAAAFGPGLNIETVMMHHV